MFIEQWKSFTRLYLVSERNTSHVCVDQGACLFKFLISTLFSSPNAQVSVTSNSSIYTFRASRLDNQVKYQCQISNQALVTPIRLEKYLHVKCEKKTKS